jgi:hypothetical protein
MGMAGSCDCGIWSVLVLWDHNDDGCFRARLGMLLKLMESCIDGKGCRGSGGIKRKGNRI